jgi:uncharacterized protein (TIGR03086 family)
MHVEVGGLTIAYERAGTRPPVALAHGFVGDGRSTWDSQIEGLADEFTVIAWDAPGAGKSSDPPEGWVARDVVRHLVEWMPGLYFGSTGMPVREAPSVDEDPAGAWRAVDHAVAAVLADPELCKLPTRTPAGEMTLEELVAMTGLMDLLVHTWDLARATGQDERLPPDEVHDFLVGIEPWDAALRASGQYGPRVAVPDDADEQTRLLAFTGRRP